MQGEKILRIYLRNGILLFWALWFSLCGSSDLINLMQQLNWLPRSIAFNSKNYDLVVQHFAVYQITSPAILLIVFSIITALALLTGIFYWIAFLYRDNFKVYLAFSSGILLTVIFIFRRRSFHSIQYRTFAYDQVDFAIDNLAPLFLACE